MQNSSYKLGRSMLQVIISISPCLCSFLIGDFLSWEHSSMVNRAHFVILVLAYRLLVSLSAEANHATESYVVYMGGGGGSGDAEAVRAAHLEMLSSIIPSDEPERASLTHSYHHAFEGFTAELTEEEAAALSGHEKVVSVFRDRALQLHTTRSWDFLDVQSGLRSERLARRASGDVIIGVVDTGVWPEAPSFNDAGMGEVPARWRGVCMEGPDFKKSNCNKKLIGARYYSNQPGSAAASNASLSGVTAATGSPRDTVAHGTHCASTAAGAVVADADYYGLARGTAKGGAPASRVATYKACSLGGCSSSALLKAIDDAVSDGVDVISVSIGASSGFASDFLSDPIALGAFHAHQRGVLVVCSAGNDGPDPYTVVNSAPWILTVAASSIDRTFQSSIVLGNGNVVKGVAINFSNQSLSGERYPLVFGPQVASRYTPVSEASNCYPGSLDAQKVAGKIVVCVGTEPTVSRGVKRLVAEEVGARGLVLIDDVQTSVPSDTASFAFSQVGTDVGAQILEYMNSTKYPTAVILPTEDVKEFNPAPVVAPFSARGPGGLTESILKPDLMAPGVSILAASMPPTDKADIPAGKKPSAFSIRSGTSMACPHVAGAGAFVKSAHPGWSPSMIRSALMTTATTRNNLGQPVSSSTGAAATGHDMGAGEISPLRALSPGLVFDTTTKDYLNFLCYYGYKQNLVRRVSGDARFACPRGAPSPDLIATGVNYPSISVPRLMAGKAVVVSRTAMNVGPSNATYAAAVEAPAGLAVKVSPERLVFSGRWTTAVYEVSFASAGASKGYAHGAVTWSDGAHTVRTPFAVNVV